MKCAPCLPDLLPLSPCALQQHPCYGGALSAMGGQVQRLGLYEANQIIALAQIITRRLGPLRVNWLPRGPVWQPNSTTDQRRAALETLHAACRGLWLANPDSVADANLLRTLGYRALLTPQHVAELDLTNPENTRLAAQHGKWRNRLRRAQNHAESGALQITSRTFDPDGDTGLLQHEQAQRRARRYTALPAAFTRAWSATSPDTAHLHLARHNGQTVAFMLMLAHKPTATYHIGWTSARGRSMMAHHLLLWNAANALSAQGFARLDLGIVDTHTASGLARFKIGTGAHVRPLGPTMIRLRL